MEKFSELKLPEQLLNSIKAMKYETPTPIQAQAIPAALEGKDILGSAQTGTGKTAAFGIPLVNHLLENGRSSALIMTPTRELAMQVKKALEDMIGKSSIKAALLIGGEPMPKQTRELRARPRLIVGTPGRINDHIERGNMMLHHTDFLVLDETDRMLDMGFLQQIERIVKFLPVKRQTLLFSATLPANIVKMSKQYLTDPVRVSVEPTQMAAPKIKQEVLHIEQKDKYDELIHQLDRREGSVIIFMKTKWNAKKMADRIAKTGHSAEAIHGDLTQNTRSRVIKSFRDNKYRVLVATDIAARGLDIPHIEHVINYDLPQCPEDYIHRIGRTARAGAEGSALSFLTSADKQQWKEISRLLDPNAAPEQFPHAKEGANQGGASSKRTNSSKRRRPSSGGGARDGAAKTGGSSTSKKPAQGRKKYAGKSTGAKFGGQKIAGKNLNISG